MNDIAIKENQNKSLMPQTFEERYKMASVLAKSGLIPNGLNTPEKVCVALQWGLELGLSPMVAVNNIAVVNGKPTLSADIMHAICRHNPEYGGLEWIEQSDKVAELRLTRISGGVKEVTIGRYSIEDARNAGLLVKDNWKKYPVRMLKHRALSYALRDAFPDALAGIYMPEEMETLPQSAPQEINITPTETRARAETASVKDEEIEELECVEPKEEAQNKITIGAPSTSIDELVQGASSAQVLDPKQQAYSVAMDIAEKLKTVNKDGVSIFTADEMAQFKKNANTAYKNANVDDLFFCLERIKVIIEKRTNAQEASAPKDEQLEELF